MRGRLRLGRFPRTSGLGAVSLTALAGLGWRPPLRRRSRLAIRARSGERWEPLWDAGRCTRSVRRPDEVERPLGPVLGYLALAHVDRVEGADQHVDGDVRIGRWREFSG
jgi:hypothetical protein